MPRPWTHEALEAAEALGGEVVHDLVAEVRRLNLALVDIARLGNPQASDLAQKALGHPYALALLAELAPRMGELADKHLADDGGTDGD